MGYLRLPHLRARHERSCAATSAGRSLSSILLVLAGLLMLFSFFDLIYEMRDHRPGQRTPDAPC